MWENGIHGDKWKQKNMSHYNVFHESLKIKAMYSEEFENTY